MKPILKNIVRILIILAAAGLIIAGLSALASSTGGTAMQGHAFEGSLAGGASNLHAEGHGNGSSPLGLLELVKNIGVIGLIITAYWFIQNGLSQIKRKSRLAI
jgi:hypothetical protein